MSGDTMPIKRQWGRRLELLFKYLLHAFIGSYVVAFFKGWLLTLAMLVLRSSYCPTGAVMNNLIMKLASNGQTTYSGGATVVEETIGSIKTVASFTGEKEAIFKYNNSLHKAYKSVVQEGLTSGLGSGALTLMVYCTYALAAWFGGIMILEKEYKGADVMVVMFAVIIGSMSLGKASPCVSAFASGQAAAYKMFETINRKPEMDTFDTSGMVLQDIRGDIELKDVCFSYPTRPDKQIFHEFFLSISSGETTAGFYDSILCSYSGFTRRFRVFVTYIRKPDRRVFDLVP